MYFLLFYDVVDDYVNQRAPFRKDHLQLAREAEARGDLLLGGAFDDPADGAALVFRGGDRSIVEDFVKKDPYVQNGLVKKWRIRDWKVVVGALFS